MSHTRNNAILVLVASLFLLDISCKKPKEPDNKDDGMVEMTPYEIGSIPRFPEMQPIPEDNKLYMERIMLGRMLFYDTRMSNNGESCNTCHKAENGFSSPGTSAFDNGLTSLPLINLAWYKNFMWNSRIIGSLEDVMLAEVTVRFKTDVSKINNIAEYRTAFKKYYGVSEINAEYLSKALAQFMRVMVSKDTRFEKSVNGQLALSFDEERGKAIFTGEKGDCFHCHAGIITTDNALHNNGLDADYAKEIDKGYYNVTKNPAHLGMFRTPILRNVALRTDYMHDGRFKTLEEVVDFYNDNVHIVENVDAVMRKPNRVNGSLGLTGEEKAQLIAFLHTLTDSTMIKDTLYRNPFQ